MDEQATKTKRTVRRFTPDENARLVADFNAYVPTIEIARRLGRSEEVVRQRVLYLGLRRSGYVTKALAWAPEHLKAVLLESGEKAFIDACYAWREQERAWDREKTASEIDAENSRIAHEAALIDARTDLTRNQKMVSKRVLGMTLEAIGKQVGITHERVRQLTSVDYILSHRQSKKNFYSVASIDQQIWNLKAEKEILIGSEAGKLIQCWKNTSVESQELFLKEFNLQRIA